MGGLISLHSRTSFFDIGERRQNGSPDCRRKVSPIPHSRNLDPSCMGIAVALRVIPRREMGPDRLRNREVRDHLVRSIRGLPFALCSIARRHDTGSDPGEI